MSNQKAEKAAQESYRIGDFCKYLGVTPDFLKHYEQFGLIQPEIEDNGYRYYPFHQASRVIECMKLRNHGFTLKEMESLMNERSEAEVLEALRSKSDELEKQLQFQYEMLKEYQCFSELMRHMDGKHTYWTIETSESALFLPHTNVRNFLNDPRIYDLLPEWVHWMPMVRSAVLLKENRPDDASSADWRKGCVWGFKMPQRLADTYHIPVNDVVIPLPSKRTLNFYFSDMEEQIEHPGSPFAILWKTIDSLSLQPAGPIIKELYMITHAGPQQHINGCFLVPLE